MEPRHSNEGFPWISLIFTLHISSAFHSSISVCVCEYPPLFPTSTIEEKSFILILRCTRPSGAQVYGEAECKTVHEHFNGGMGHFPEMNCYVFIKWRETNCDFSFIHRQRESSSLQNLVQSHTLVLFLESASVETGPGRCSGHVKWGYPVGTTHRWCLVEIRPLHLHEDQQEVLSPHSQPPLHPLSTHNAAIVAYATRYGCVGSLLRVYRRVCDVSMACWSRANQCYTDVLMTSKIFLAVLLVA